MGRIVRVVKTAVVDGVRIITVDPGNESFDDAELYLPPGEDSMPQVGDLVVVVSAVLNGGPIVVGTLDESTPDGVEGKKRIYSRGSSGTPKAWVTLNVDGSIEISNGSGTFTMATSGKVTINGNLEVLP